MILRAFGFTLSVNRENCVAPVHIYRSGRHCLCLFPHRREWLFGYRRDFEMCIGLGPLFLFVRTWKC